MAAKILFLHGPSSSGKSTLARAIRAASEQPWMHLSIDHLRDSKATQRGHFAAGRSRFFDGFHRALAGFADAGNDLIVEHILDTDGWQSQLSDLFRSHQVLFVGVHTDLATLQAREIDRGDRPHGSAEQDFFQVHRGRTYDLTVSGTDNPKEVAQRLLQTPWPAPGDSNLHHLP